LCIPHHPSEACATCKALLTDKVERGPPAERPLLFVIDGAKAPHKALTDTFGARALILRCRPHKIRARPSRSARVTPRLIAELIIERRPPK
jgi:hypothetical protein